MKYIKLFEEYGDKILIIVDVQRSFHKFFTKNYLVELNKYAATFNKVYQIFDNHHDGKNVDKDFLYDENPDIENIYINLTTKLVNQLKKDIHMMLMWIILKKFYRKKFIIKLKTKNKIINYDLVISSKQTKIPY